MRQFTRRKFLKSSIIAGALTALPYSSVLGANERMLLKIRLTRKKLQMHL